MPNGAHRRRRHRRGSGRPQVQPGGEVRCGRVQPIAGCRPDFACNWHGICAECGDTIHLATVEADFPLDVAAVAEFICGAPPRCADCRGTKP